MSTPTPGFGWLPDPPDRKDWLAGHRLVLPPPAASSASCKAYVGPVLDQGALGSCVAQAVAKQIYASHCRQGMPAPKLASRLAIYYLARATHRMQHFDSGTYLRAAYQILNKFGFCEEAAWPYIAENFATMPPAKAFRLAFDQRKPTEYLRIHETGPQRLETVRLCLAAGLPVAFGTMVGDDFISSFGVNKIHDIPASNTAGHAMLLVGYENDRFEVMNSWGPGWGNAGFGWMTEDYIAWERTQDLWVARHTPPYAGE